MDRKTYNELMAKGEDKGLSQDEFDAVKAFAREKRIKQPKPEWVKAAKKAAAKAPKAPKEKATCNPALKGSSETCDKDARSNGLCPAHYSRLVYRMDSENAEKVRKASREYAARRRAAKKATAAA